MCVLHVCGCTGTWQWGNQFLWGYDEAMDQELQELFNFLTSKGINLIDTADSYGTGKLNGRSEQLIGRFLKEYPGMSTNHEVLTNLNKP